ncbi:hypothetical protein [Methylocapsa palsarum]|uniref:Uncharacterized protein n=1 Tax=Methylocapsa palsarum TaxID=1612308 RepID=A0A1I4CQZ2_9HYPH|nr:hypothetical protein [Methylocapsa palsarum]SFK82699.1 hypothetical protein SAMN05444581_12612 [Methylocapsa palsarum]
MPVALHVAADHRAVEDGKGDSCDFSGDGLAVLIVRHSTIMPRRGIADKEKAKPRVTALLLAALPWAVYFYQL